MSDIIKCQSAITYIRETPAENFRLIDKYTQQEPVSYEHGEVTIPPSTVDMEIATDVNIFYIFTETPMTIKVGTTTSLAMTNMRSFSYNGAATKIYLSNPDAVESIKVYFVSAKII